MKTFALIALLAANVAFAAPASVYVQVLKSPEVKKLTNGTTITSIVETGAMRCMGCFRFTISQYVPSIGNQEIQVGTSANGSDKISVEIISVTK